MTADELQALLHDQIPISAAMGIRVLALEPQTVTLSAPLAANHNHANTQFAGSQHALASLAGWALLRVWAETAGWEAELVLGKADIRYLRPAAGDMTVQARLTDSQLEELDAARRGNGTGRLRLDMEIRTDAGVCARFGGQYVARGK
ncbi:YiiD C-terminal domain-containing protein [Aquisalimonas asiatica]|uniref:Thioesterase domain-containing protein, putative n=1 Tax=Aquisalimonas asiatica TaxID=406100 RepID=A0A1H8QA31_9GAMM|nr:YiiD C-terminal domain-containing protein [Aquisalimonas asiatica]SEO50774.1 thioesterase domain-containing protein, putative [Aquisalimonas asiatica]